MSDTVTNPDGFREFEFKGWQKVANRYHDTFAGVTVQSVEPLLDAAEVRAGSRALDLACGPGYAAGAAAARGAKVTGVDFSSEMVAEARLRFPAATFRQGDAEALEFPDSSFDSVTMNFGMLHLSMPERAVSEARRVLGTGGRFAFTVWQTPDQARGFGILLNAVREFGNLDVPLPPGPPFFRFSDPDEAAKLLAGANFTEVRVLKIPQVWRLRSADSLFDIMMNASVRNAALLRAQTPDALRRIEHYLREMVLTYQHSGTFDLPMPAILASGRK